MLLSINLRQDQIIDQYTVCNNIFIHYFTSVKFYFNNISRTQLKEINFYDLAGMWKYRTVMMISRWKSDLDQKTLTSTAILAAGATPEVNLRNPLQASKKHVSDLKPRSEVRNRSISGPSKRTDILQKLKKDPPWLQKPRKPLLKIYKQGHQ